MLNSRAATLQGGPVLVEDVEVLHVRHALSAPAGPPGVFNRAREALFVRLSLAGGAVGWGETYPLPGTKEILERLAASLVGREVSTTSALAHFPFDDPDAAPALGALDTALLDALGRSLQVPVHRLLGGACRSAVPAYASGFLYTEDGHPSRSWPAEAESLLARGFRALKLRVGGFPIEEELPALTALRGRLPDDVSLMVDAWGAYDPQGAVRMGRELDTLGVAWFEEPCAPRDTYAGYEWIAARIPVPLAGGESLRTIAAFRHLLERRVFRVIQPDAAICGGLGNAAFVARLAALDGVACVPHSWNGAIMAAATLQLLATLPGGMLEVDTTENMFMTHILREPLKLRDGCIAVPDAPGLGIDIDEQALRRLTI